VIARLQQIAKARSKGDPELTFPLKPEARGWKKVR